MGFIEDFYIGGIAGIVSKTTLAPIERIRMMRINYPQMNFSQLSKHIYFNDNILSFFKGNLLNCIRFVPQNALQMSIFQFSNNFTDKKHIFLSGCFAGVCSYGFVYPLETIRTKYSIGLNNNYSSTKQLCQYIFKNDGIYGFYKGIGISLIGIINFQGTIFYLYYSLKNKYNPNNNKFINIPISSFATICGILTSYPSEVIKRKYHVSGEIGNKIYTSYIDLIKTNMKVDGFKFFYRGCLPYILKAVPSNIINFFIFELLLEISNK